MEIKKYKYGHAVIENNITTAIITDKIALYSRHLSLSTTPVGKDLLEYIKEGKTTEKLEKILSSGEKMIVIYHTKNDATIYRAKIPPAKVQAIGLEFYLYNPLTEVYILPDTEHYVYYRPPSRKITIERFENRITIHLPVDTSAKYTRLIINSIKDRQKLKKIISDLFPVGRYDIDIDLVKNKVIAYDKRLALKIVASNTITVYISNRKRYTYTYGCGHQISIHGFDPSKVPCLTPV